MPLLDPNSYSLPVPGGIFSVLNRISFANFAFAEAYLHIKCGLESPELMIFNTHLGLFQHIEVPIGVKTSLATSQQIMVTVMSGLSNTATYSGYVITVRFSEQELQERAIAFLQLIPLRDSIENLGYIFNKIGHRGNVEMQKITLIPRSHQPLQHISDNSA
nr:Gap Pol polyprotein [Hymenolepis microstoma]